MNKFYVYILKSDTGFSYIGQTNNLLDRIKRHNSGRNAYTRNKGIWEIVESHMVNSRKEAVELEIKLKGMKNFQKSVNYLRKLVSKYPDIHSGGS